MLLGQAAGGIFLLGVRCDGRDGVVTRLRGNILVDQPGSGALAHLKGGGQLAGRGVPAVLRLNETALPLLNALGVGGRGGLGSPGAEKSSGRGEGDLHVPGHKEHFLHRVFQLAHITRPVILPQKLLELRRKAKVGAVVLIIGVAKMIGYVEDIVRPLPQRGDADFHRIQTPQQVLTERALPHQLGQILVGGGQNAHVHRAVFLPADGEDALAFHRCEDLGLQLQRHVPNLIQEQRAAVGQFKKALFSLGGGVGKGIGRIAEELGFQKLLGDGRAVDHQEGAVAPAAEAVNVFRQHGLAGTGFTQQQDGQLAGRASLAAFEHRLHLRGVGEETAVSGAVGRALVAVKIEVVFRRFRLNAHHRKNGLIHIFRDILLKTEVSGAIYADAVNVLDSGFLGKHGLLFPARGRQNAVLLPKLHAGVNVQDGLGLPVGIQNGIVVLYGINGIGKLLQNRGEHFFGHVEKNIPVDHSATPLRAKGKTATVIFY